MNATQLKYAKERAQQLYNYVSFNKAPTPDKESQDKEQNELKEQYTKLLDELVLGDNQQALELLKAFESNG